MCLWVQEKRKRWKYRRENGHHTGAGKGGGKRLGKPTPGARVFLSLLGFREGAAAIARGEDLSVDQVPSV